MIRFNKLYHYNIECPSKEVFKMTSKYDPGGMVGHAAVKLGNYVIVIGGVDNNYREWPLCKINIYNIYTEEWRLNTVPQPAPSARLAHSAVAIGRKIYMFGGRDITFTEKYNNEVWTLTESAKGCFVWRQIMFEQKKKTPSPRAYHGAWEYGGKLWIFGGEGYASKGYVDEHEEFENEFNKHPLCFDPSVKAWTKIQCSGKIPVSQCGQETTIIGDKVWLFGECDKPGEARFRLLYQLDMKSMIWCMIEADHSHTKPCSYQSLSFNAATDNQLVLYGGIGEQYVIGNTWIFDIPSLTWKRLAPGLGRAPYKFHTGTTVANGRVLILGGKERTRQKRSHRIIALQPRSLQQLAMIMISKHRSTLPLQDLPNSIIATLQG